jgi:hypothetical protein
MREGPVILATIIGIVTLILEAYGIGTEEEITEESA